MLFTRDSYRLYLSWQQMLIPEKNTSLHLHCVFHYEVAEYSVESANPESECETEHLLVSVQSTLLHEVDTWTALSSDARCLETSQIHC